jgi:Macrocin-O-methyltransferase (TylF)
MIIAYSTGGIVPTLKGNVFFHKGLFRDTIPPFLERAGKDAFLAFANVDCDLYSSTLDILEAFEGRIVAGTVLVFDEYICHATWRQDEFRAWRECCKRFGWKYEYIGFSLSTKQAAVKVIEA